MSLFEKLQEELEDVHLYGGGYFSCRCPNPKHPDNSPSCLVYEDGFHCKGCGIGGKLEYLAKLAKVSSIHGIVSVERQKFLPRWSKWNDVYGDVANLCKTVHQNTMNFEPYKLYFKKRKIDGLIERCKLGYKDGWALFPIIERDGTIIDAVVRDTLGRGDTKYIIHPDEERETTPIYVPNWRRVDSESTCYIVYGMIDALALELCGLPVITGTSGKFSSNKRLMKLNKKWVIIPDRYEEAEAYKLSQQLGMKSRVKLLKYPPDCKDPDDIRMKYGLETLKEMIR